MTLHRPFLLAASLLLLACNATTPKQTPIPPQDERPQTVVCTDASLVYYGDMDGIEISNLHKLTLHTPMEVNEQGYPIGPGTIIQLSLNTTPQSGASKDITLPAGKYLAAATAQDFAPFTFNFGYLVQIDLPDGKVELPDGSFYGEIESGQTVFVADKLTEGSAVVTKNSDNTYTVDGVVVGDKCTKRYFTFTGELNVVDRSGGIEPVVNTTLTSDIVLSDLTKARIEDRGDHYYLNDQSYRAFNLYLAASTINLTEMWATGNGNLLQIEFFVPFATDPANGIPEGKYTVTARTASGGIDRQNIIPFNISPGYPNKFTNPEGAWYLKYVDGKAKEFARIDGGSMTVVRNGDAHSLTIELTDCITEAPHKISATFNQSTPIEVFEFQSNLPPVK